MNLLLPLIVAAPLLLGTALTAWAAGDERPSRRRLCAATAAAVAGSAFLMLLALAPTALSGTVLLWQAEWVPGIGLNLGFRLDALAWMFAALITGIGLLVILYAAYYLHDEDPVRRFYPALMLFMAAMLGIVLSDNLLLLVVFWELTSISSFLLIGYWGRLEESRQGARMALAVTGGGGLALLGGVVLLGQIAGTYELSAMLARADAILAHPWYPAALVLVLLGCFTKSAQVPFHFWLPQAMAAPTPVSAYLHSATMVKAGLFLLLRLDAVIGGSALFEGLVATAGLVTMVFAAAVAIFRHDLKGLLAYSTVSHLGLVTFLIGLASPLATVAAVFHILNHAAFKAALFMSAGIVDHETGTRDMRRLGGLFAAMPVVGTLVMLAGAAMAGLPPFNGFISKEMMLDEALRAPGSGLWGSLGGLVPVLATLGGLFSAAYSLRLVHDTFFGAPAKDLPHPHPHEPPWGMKAPVLLLVGVCILVGLLPMAVAGPLVGAVSAAVLALAGGAALYAAMMRGGWLHRAPAGPVQAKALFWWLSDRLFELAGRFTQRVESRSLQSYAAWMVGAVVVVAAWALTAPAGEAPATGLRPRQEASPLAVVVWLLLLAAAGATVLLQHRRVVAVVLAGAVGLVASLSFLSLSAPDLAMTQISVDVVSTVLLLMGLALLPPLARAESAPWRRWRDGALALAGGGGIAWLTWLVLTRDFGSISWYFLENAVPKGGGTNLVNVILVDFRGYDTWGEITVLGIAGVGVLALLDGLRARRPATDEAGRAWSFAQPPLMLRQVARLVLPLALVVSVFVFWRGHGLPGGGFIAGLVTAVALVLQYMAGGQGWAEGLLHAGGGTRYTRWIGSGLLIAGLCGAGALLLGRPFLTSAHGHPVLPVLGEAPLATAAIFDLGVYITVVGATMLMLAALAAATKEGPRRVAAAGGRA
ncbi:hydrogen gas-evolving membrane-bound hydrogenase subunit E [Piscinibacter sakaiensis]|uniref:hydrogen gas-evolving membrane-bound hydrogenase subunit E n=1 Tax=Piscinibacter sakaiensis TaxID=1547922 RepID=UPI00372804E2